MVDISSGDKKINITVSTSGNKASVNASPDTAMYYSNKSREWAISGKIVDGEDYSSKYYANISKQNADKSTVNLENLTTNYNQYKTDLENTKNISVEEIETAKTNAISDITNQETLSVDNVNTAGSTQVNLAKEQATIATTQAGIATAKTSEVVESGNNAITAITEQETTSKNNIETKGTEQIELIQNEGATQIANVQSTGFYMRDDKLYFINSQGEETEFKSGGLPIGTIIPVNATSNYVPEGALPCDGAEYTKEQFTDLWNNYLTAETPLLPTCTYTEYQTAINTYGSCAKFGIITGEKLNPDYTYIGDLSVGSSGIASNFSSSNYATAPVSFTLTPESNFYYKARVKLYADISGGFKRCITAFYYGDTFNNNELQLSYLGDNGHMDFYFHIKHADGWGTIALIKVGEYFNEGDWVTVEYIKNGTTFTTKVTNDLGETHEATTENISIKTNTYTLARIGKGDDVASDYYMSDIDLSSVLIKVDDVEIFNGTKSNTFKVPTIKDGSVIQQALTDSELCKSYNAGLPNITGEFEITQNKTSPVGAYRSGAFKNGTSLGSKPGYTNASSSYAQNRIAIDASLSSTKYGNSDTVQMNAVALRYFVVVANGQTNQSMMDWSAWASSLQGKANTDLSNCTKPYIKTTYVNGTSGYRIWSDGYCEQWGRVTNTKASGTVTFIKTFNNTDYIVVCQEGESSTYEGSGSDTNGYADNIGITNGTVNSFRYSITAKRYFNWIASGYLASGQY